MTVRILPGDCRTTLASLDAALEAVWEAGEAYEFISNEAY